MNDDDAVGLLTRMLEIPSLSGAEGPLAYFLAEQMKELGFDEAGVDEAGNAVGVIGHGPRQLVFLGHMDTVPGEIPVEVTDGRLYGRGAVDAKGPLASFIAGARRAGPREGWSIVVIGAVEEEAPTSKGARHVAPIYHPDACVIGEPSGWDSVTMGYKGRLLVDYRQAGGVAHSAGPQRSICERGVAFWNAVAAATAEHDADCEKLFERLDPALLEIDSTSDGLEQEVHLSISFRTPLGFDARRWEAELRRLAEVEAEGAGQPPRLTFYGGEPAYRGEKNTPLVRAFLAAIRAGDGKPSFKVKTGTSDMNVVGPVWSCPILAYGPGDSKLDHTPEEHIVLEEYLAGVGVVARAIEHLTATP